MKSKFIASVLVCFSFLLSFVSCNKIDATDLGAGLIPAVDNINTFDTTIYAITDNKLFADTTRMLYNEDHALGIIENDAEFGKTTATIYSSFAPGAYRPSPFPPSASVIIDSAILSLSYTNIFGDSNAVQQIEVREMDPALPFADSAYRVTAPDFTVLPAVIGTGTINYGTIKDTIVYKNAKDTVRTNNELRIPLDTAWARNFVSSDTASGGLYNNDTAFKARFKGLEIKATDISTHKTALGYFDLDDNTRSRITFYCRAVKSGGTDTIAPAFIYTNDPHANIIRRTPANNYLAAINNGVDNDPLIYIQPAPGSYATVALPGLESLGNRVIHRAELILDQYPSADNFYSPPSRLYVDIPGANGDSSYTIRNDFVPSRSVPYYDVASLGGIFSKNRYVFNLTRYVQSICTKGFPNPSLRVYSPFYNYSHFVQPNSDIISPDRFFIMGNTPVSFGRVVLYGGAESDPAKRLRLRIIYSKI